MRIRKKTMLSPERLSLVDFANSTGVQRLEAAIELAGQIRQSQMIQIIEFIMIGSL